MKPYYESGGITIYHGDCREILPGLPADSFDCIVTDPPYGLAFMGKEWDHGIPGVEFWTQVLRVAKPGAHLLAFGGTRTFHRLACAIEDTGWEIRDCIMWVYSQGFPKSHNLKGDWQGWGTALKPAWEPIIVARKPLVGTVAENVQKHGTGAINIDKCRIPSGDVVSNHSRSTEAAVSKGKFGDSSAQETHQTPGQTIGRFPANLIHDGSAEVMATFPDAPGQCGRARTDRGRKTNKIYGKLNHVAGSSVEPRGDSGSAARFFYCAKASRSERGEGNDHPTVKPLSLMRYLVRLVTPPGGTVLDPFMGSGTTAVAAREKYFRFVGCEIEEKYCEIAAKRLAQECLFTG